MPAIDDAEQHLAAGFVVARVGHRPGQELGDNFQRPNRPHVADRIRALIRRPQNRPLRPRTAVVKGIAVYDSSAWLSTSSPDAAATAAGIVRVLSGSTMPSVGRK